MARAIDSYLDCRAEVDGRWVIARPIPSSFIQDRIHDAWLVLTGKADAVTFCESRSKGEE